MSNPIFDNNANRADVGSAELSHQHHDNLPHVLPGATMMIDAAR